MQRRKSVFNNEMEQRFSLRKYTIGLCSVCLGFVTIGMGSQSVKADTVNNVEKSSVVREDKMQDADSATAKPNITSTETKKNEIGSVATTAPKTNTTSNGVNANTADSAISTETKPTKANSTLANSNIVSAQAKSAKAELEVQPKVGATSTKIKLQETKLAKSADANNAVVVNTSDQSKSEDSNAVAPTSEDSKDIEVKPKESSNVDTNEQKKKDVTLVTNSPASETNASSKLVQTVSPEQPAAPTTPVTNKASHESNSQAQPSSSIDNTHTKLVRRPVMRLAAATATNSDELIVGKDVTISDFSVTAAEGKNEFENAHANIKFTMHADDPSALAGKRLTIQVDTKTKVWGGFYSSEQQDSNPATISYQGHVIGTLSYGYPFYFVYITFNDDVKNYTKIDVQSDLVVAGTSQHAIPYRTSLYTPTQAKDGQTYYLTNDVTIGQQKYSSNLPSVIHYRALDSEFVSSVTDVTTTSYAQRDNELYAGTFYKTPNGIYYSQSSIYGGNNLYSKQSGQSGYLEGPSINVGTDIVTDRTQSYTATSDIDQTKLSPAPGSKLVPTKAYYLTKYYWDDKDLLPNTRDVYVDDSYTYSTTVTADATVIKNGVIFNKLNGQSLATRIVNAEGTNSHSIFSRNTNYIDYDGKLYLTPALFKQLQAVAESDQNLTEAINTVKTTGMDAEIKLAKPIDTGLKVTIKTSDGKIKEVPLLIDTIDYVITTASTAPKGAMLVATQGKTAKVYHPGDQNIPAVVDQNKLTKTITRTINVHEPGKKVTTIKQDVVMTQSVSVVDGKDVTYNGDWKVQGDSHWASYDVPSVSGYTASQSHVVQQAVTDTTKDQTVNITYTANDGTQTIVYQDEDGSEIGKQVISGKTDEKVKVTSDVPDGYVVKGEVPSEVTIKPDDTPITITIKHGKSHIDPDKPVNSGEHIPGTTDKTYPSGLTHDDLNKTITREVTITDPTGKNSTTTQTVTFTRGATVDEVTNEVTYDDWSENGKHTFDKVDVPTVPGYTVSGEAPEVVVTPETQPSTVNITYTPKEYTVYIFYGSGSDTPWTHRTTEHRDYPDDFDKWANGKQGLAKPEILTGHYGESISIPIKKITGYHVDPEADYTKYKFGIDSITGQELNWFGPDEKELVDPVDPSDPDYEFSTPRYITVQYVKDSTNNGYNIAYVDTYGAVINRPDNLRGVSGEATNYTAPEINGYTLTNPQDVPINFGDGTKDVFLVYKPQDVKVTYHYVDEKGKELAPSVVENNHFTGLTKVDENTKQIAGYSLVSTPKQRVVEDLKDLDLSFVYTANNGTQTIIYQGEDDSEIGKQVIHGKTDETVKVTPDVPDGYVVKGEVPSEVTIKPDDTPITITIEHGKSHIDPDKPVNSGEHIPGTTDKTYPSGLTHDDLNKTITREVTITDPTGKNSTTTQTVTFTRGATVDEVTNEVTYDDWSENGKHTFDKVDVPTVQGYTASGDVPSLAVTPDSQSTNVTVTYNANEQTATITYIDDTEKKSLGSDKQNGKFNQVITFEHDPAEVIKGLEEKGYKLVSNDFNDNKYQADNSNNVFYVHLKHGTSESSRKDDVNMTVHYVMDDGSKAPSDSTQTVSFTENGIKDNVTGNITWTPATSQTLKDVDSPVLTGYTADIKTANGKVVNFGDPDINVTVHYSANAQTAKITYIDDTEKKALGSETQNGKFDHEIIFEYDPAEVIKGLEEKGYKLVSDDFKPGIKYQNDNKFNIFEVHLVHTYEPVETSQTITETVHYIDANGKPVAPDHVAEVVIKVTGTRDKVTDSIIWNTPSTGHFDKVISPKLPNMIPDKKLIPGRDVQYGDSDITESVVYTPYEIPREPEEPNDQGKPNSKTPEKPNKPSKEVSKQFGTIAKTTIPEKPIDSRTVDNHVLAKSTAKQELPQTGATTNTGILTGLVSMIAGLGLLGASKKRKKN